jgi:hypothetical protein
VLCSRSTISIAEGVGYGGLLTFVSACAAKMRPLRKSSYSLKTHSDRTCFATSSSRLAISPAIEEHENDREP